jgi:hypothetical protein
MGQPPTSDMGHKLRGSLLSYPPNKIREKGHLFLVGVPHVQLYLLSRYCLVASMSVHVASTNCVTELDRCTSVAHTFLHFGVHELALWMRRLTTGKTD